MTEVCKNKEALEEAINKAAKAADTAKKLRACLRESKETIRLLEAQLEKINSKKSDVDANAKRIETTLFTIKNIKRMNKGDTIPAESLSYIEEDLTEEYTLQLEHKA